jgi:hypothetical protein
MSQVTCPHCRATYTVEGILTLSTVTCPSCSRPAIPAGRSSRFRVKSVVNGEEDQGWVWPLAAGFLVAGAAGAGLILVAAVRSASAPDAAPTRPAVNVAAPAGPESRPTTR